MQNLTHIKKISLRYFDAMSSMCRIDAMSRYTNRPDPTEATTQAIAECETV